MNVALHLPQRKPTPAFSTTDSGFFPALGKTSPSACRVVFSSPSRRRSRLSWTPQGERRSGRGLGRAKKCGLEVTEILRNRRQNSPYCRVHLLWRKWACRTASDCRLSLAHRRSASIRCTRSWIHLNSLLAFFGTEIDLRKGKSFVIETRSRWKKVKQETRNLLKLKIFVHLRTKSFDRIDGKSQPELRNISWPLKKTPERKQTSNGRSCETFFVFSVMQRKLTRVCGLEIDSES